MISCFEKEGEEEHADRYLTKENVMHYGSEMRKKTSLTIRSYQFGERRE